jgi:hypothetical protein
MSACLSRMPQCYKTDVVHAMVLEAAKRVTPRTGWGHWASERFGRAME